MALWGLKNLCTLLLPYHRETVYDANISVQLTRKQGHGSLSKEVARFHQGSSSSRSRPKHSYLEIGVEGTQLADLILLTWIYTEQKKRERNKSATMNASVMAGASSSAAAAGVSC